MRSIVLALTELLGVLVAGFLGFFVMLAYAAGFLLLLLAASRALASYWWPCSAWACGCSPTTLTPFE